ncbi:MAG: hypothetical protein KAT58_04525, partial [candidate division Zixibacteria bacterium]|nr:hypothetical protein [candidate division Zixibacteria bacterium]
WISEHERRLVRNTYIFFDCWDAAKKEGGPTFEYGIQRAINDGYLSNYRIYHAESVLTYEGAEWEGEEIKPGAWGRDVESEDRLKTIIQEYFSADAERASQLPPPEAVACRIAVPWKGTYAILLKGKDQLYFNTTVEPFMVSPPEVVVSTK